MALKLSESGARANGETSVAPIVLDSYHPRMIDDRVVEVCIVGMRCIERLHLSVGGVKVLIGENGAGKSTVIEALELLRKAGHPGFIQALYAQHFGLSALLRQQADRLEIGLKTEGPQGAMEYHFALGFAGEKVVVVSEVLTLDTGKPKPLQVIDRGPTRSRVFSQAERKLIAVEVETDQLMVSAFGVLPPQVAIDRMLKVLRGIEVHLPFDVTARWAARQSQRSSPLRESTLVEATTGLSLFGANLASAWHTLRQDFGTEHWEETLAWVRLGLGYDIETVDTSARLAEQPGRVALAIRDRRYRQPIPAHSMSDGMLAWLGMIALCRLSQHKSIIAFDEPELHFHPALLGRTVQLFEACSKDVPMVLATHSDRLLDGLSDPIGSVIQCGLDDQGIARFLKADPAEFDRWLNHYAGLGSMRAAGVADVILSQEAG